MEEVIDLSRSTIEEQIREVDSAAEDYPEHLNLLTLHKAILEILMPIAKSPKKGAREALSGEAFNNLQEKAAASKKPISSFLYSSIFDEDTVLSIARDITQCLMRRRPGGEALEGFLKALEKEEINARDAIEAILEEDAAWFQHLSERFGVESSLLLFIFDTTLRPFFEEIARKVESVFIETWWEPFCPVCGRTSNVARIRQRKRYMTCTYCGAEYLVDLFLCVNCGNKDPYTLGFITFEEHPEYELNYCEKCDHYIKIVYEERLRRRIPKGLEGLLTQELDILAEENKLSLSRT